MNIFLKRFLPYATFVAFGLSGCAPATLPPGQSTRPNAAETISYEVGPCFGFCPVYEAAIAADGLVSFEGRRHTATIGPKAGNVGPAAYRDLAAALAPFRPATGSNAATSCDTSVSDQQHYRIVWTSADGTKTVLEHDRGCRSTRNDALNAVLDSAPERLGIADDAKQLTRPGVSRG